MAENGTNIKIDVLRDNKTKIEIFGTEFINSIDAIVANINEISSALSGTSYSIAAGVSNTLSTLTTLKDATYGCLSAQNSYLDKKITSFETAALVAGDKLQAALDSLSSIWDTVDKTTWSFME